MDEGEWLARSFEAHRAHLRAVAYRMLGSLADADDAVQETWLRLARSDTSGVQNLGGWLTTVAARVCLDMLRARAARREDPLHSLPDPIVSPAAGPGPEQQALLADSVGLALLVVLDTLSPTERLAFVLHDVFAVPFEEIARILDRSPAAAKQLASRARGGWAVPRPLRMPTSPASGKSSMPSSRRHATATSAPCSPCSTPMWCCAPTPVPGRWARRGWCTARGRWPGRRLASPGSRGSHGRCWSTARPDSSPPRTDEPISVMGMTIRGDKIVEIDVLADPDRLGRLDLTALDG